MLYQTAFGRARALPLPRSGVPPEPPQPYSFAASLMRCGPSARAPNEGALPPQTPRRGSGSGVGIPWGGRSTPTLRVGLPPHGSIPKSTFLADLGKERVDEQVCPSTLIPVCLLARPPRHGSRTARGGARMRGQAPSNSPLSRLFVTRHTSRIYSVVVAEYIRAPI